MRKASMWTAMLIFASAGLTAALAGGGNFDHLSDADRQAFQERFVKEIWPTLERGGKNGCLNCHGPRGKGGGSLKMSADPAKNFRLLVKEGFFLPDDSGSLLTRVTTKNKKQMMPPPSKGERWTAEDVAVLQKFVADLEKKQQKRKTP
jgi:hypothetical protein